MLIWNFKPLVLQRCARKCIEAAAENPEIFQVRQVEVHSMISSIIAVPQEVACSSWTNCIAQHMCKRLKRSTVIDIYAVRITVWNWLLGAGLDRASCLAQSSVSRRLWPRPAELPHWLTEAYKYKYKNIKSKYKIQMQENTNTTRTALLRVWPVVFDCRVTCWTVGQAWLPSFYCIQCNANAIKAKYIRKKKKQRLSLFGFVALFKLISC